MLLAFFVTSKSSRESLLSSVRLTGAVVLLFLPLLPVFADIEDNTGAELTVAATIDSFLAHQENLLCVYRKKPFILNPPKAEYLPKGFLVLVVAGSLP